MDIISYQTNLLCLPMDVLNKVFSFLTVQDVGRMQGVSRTLYNFIMTDSQFTYFNTLKFFELYYRKRLFAVFLFPYIHPRYSYRTIPAGEDDDNDAVKYKTAYLDGSAHKNEMECDEESYGNTVVHVAAANGLYGPLKNYFTMECKGQLIFPRFSKSSIYNKQCHRKLYLKSNNESSSILELENEEPNTPLHYISIVPEDVDERCVISTARMLIREGADIWKKGRAGNTVLAEAAQHGHLGMVQMILAEVERKFRYDEKILADYINTYNDYSENAVIMAARTSPEVLELLLRKGGDPNSSRRGYPLLTILASGFRLDRRDPLTFESYHRQRTSRWATSWPRMTDCENEPQNTTKNHEQVITRLLEAGADPSRPEKGTGMTPLQMAAFWGDVRAIETIVRIGKIDPNNERNQLNDWLPVHYACSEGQIFALEALINLGAQIWEDDEDEFPAELALSRTNVPGPLELLGFDALKKKLLNYAKSLREAKI